MTTSLYWRNLHRRNLKREQDPTPCPYDDCSGYIVEHFLFGEVKNYKCCQCDRDPRNY